MNKFLIGTISGLLTAWFLKLLFGFVGWETGEIILACSGLTIAFLILIAMVAGMDKDDRWKNS